MNLLAALVCSGRALSRGPAAQRVGDQTDPTGESLLAGAPALGAVMAEAAQHVLLVAQSRSSHAASSFRIEYPHIMRRYHDMASNMSCGDVAEPSGFVAGLACEQVINIAHMHACT